MQYAVPAKVPQEFGIEPSRGCPLDCGLCTEHEQHTCIGLIEITSSCNLTCPMCFASSAPGGNHLSVAECKQAIDRLVEVEGRPEVLQLSGGEPTVHPQFREILDYAIAQPIDYVTINTNGIRFAKDPALVEHVAGYKDRLEMYFQLDSLRDADSVALRGEPLLETKLRALKMLGEAGIHITLAVTLQGGVNNAQLGELVRFAVARPWVTGISFQPATYSGRYVVPEELENRITFPDVIKGVAEQTDGMFGVDDFMPLPCAHPNCHSISYAFRHHGTATPLMRFIDARNNLDLLANGVVFTREKSRDLMLSYLGRQGCCGGDCGTENHATPLLLPTVSVGENGSAAAAKEFFSKAIAQQLGATDIFRITVTSFLDAYNFDVRRVMKCCTHHVLPSGHVIPFCAYNVLYREGHVPLPQLRKAAVTQL
jgi:uncharacterized radical SAM superfamily Fe-S cluster-containing enzyme